MEGDIFVFADDEKFFFYADKFVHDEFRDGFEKLYWYSI